MTLSEDAWILALPVAIVGFGLYLMAIIISTGETSPVSIHSEGVVADTVQVGGKLSVQFTANRQRDCPGIVVHAFTQLGTGETNQVIMSYPALETAVGVYKRKQQIDMPRLVTAGRWRYVATLDSDCAGRRISDRIVAADVDVTP